MVIVISVGGSLIIPDDIDTDFLTDFRKVVLESDERFIIVTGGGMTARKYQKAGRDVCDMKDDDLDWLGIHSTRINAHLFRTMFKEHAHPQIVHHPDEEIEWDEKILLAAGSKPGWSTDYVSVLLAEKFRAERILNLSNIDFVYDKDPKNHDDAKPLEKISWDDFLDIIPKDWSPGLNTPFDPVASRKAAELGLEVAIMSGDMENVQNYLENRKFSGTVIR